MKNFSLFLIVCSCSFTTVIKGQTLELPQKHRIGVGPILGYDHKLEGTTYGAGLMCEYKAFRKVGFTAGFNYEQTRKDLVGQDFADNGAGLLKHHMYALNLGARYYMNSFYLGGALGLAHESGESKMDDGTTFKGGSANSLYKSLGLGYQLPFRNGDLLEMEIGTFGTKNSMKFGGMVRYKFLK